MKSLSLFILFLALSCGSESAGPATKSAAASGPSGSTGVTGKIDATGGAGATGATGGIGATGATGTTAGTGATGAPSPSGTTTVDTSKLGANSTCDEILAAGAQIRIAEETKANACADDADCVVGDFMVPGSGLFTGCQLCPGALNKNVPGLEPVSNGPNDPYHTAPIGRKIELETLANLAQGKSCVNYGSACGGAACAGGPLVATCRNKVCVTGTAAASTGSAVDTTCTPGESPDRIYFDSANNKCVATNCPQASDVEAFASMVMCEANGGKSCCMAPNSLEGDKCVPPCTNASGDCGGTEAPVACHSKAAGTALDDASAWWVRRICFAGPSTDDTPKVIKDLGDNTYIYQALDGTLIRGMGNQCR